MSVVQANICAFVFVQVQAFVFASVQALSPHLVEAHRQHLWGNHLHVDWRTWCWHASEPMLCVLLYTIHRTCCWAHDHKRSAILSCSLSRALHGTIQGLLPRWNG